MPGFPPDNNNHQDLKNAPPPDGASLINQQDAQGRHSSAERSPLVQGDDVFSFGGSQETEPTPGLAHAILARVDNVAREAEETCEPTVSSQTTESSAPERHANDADDANDNAAPPLPLPLPPPPPPPAPAAPPTLPAAPVQLEDENLRALALASELLINMRQDTMDRPAMYTDDVVAILQAKNADEHERATALTSALRARHRADEVRRAGSDARRARRTSAHLNRTMRELQSSNGFVGDAPVDPGRGRVRRAPRRYGAG